MTIDLDNKIIRNHDTLYKAVCDFCHGDRNYVKRSAASKPCRKCARARTRDKNSKLPPVCSICGLVDSSGDEFYKDKRKANGFTSWCKTCYKKKVNNYIDNNRDKYFATKAGYIKKRTKTDPVFRARNNIKTRINYSLRKGGYSKRSNTKEIVGCSFEDLVKHLEDTFKNVYNRPVDYSQDDVHIDHIIPVSTANSEEDVIRLNHYTNLQYLLAEDNLKKSNKIDD